MADNDSSITAPTPGVGFLAQPSYHIVHSTPALSALDAAGVLLASVQGALCDGKPIQVGERTVLPLMVLDRIDSLLQRAMAEVKEQRAQASGWAAFSPDL